MKKKPYQSNRSKKQRKSKEEDNLNQRKNAKPIVYESKENTIDQLYLNGPASFGSAKKLQNFSKLPMKKIKMYLETQLSFTKYRSRRLRFSKLKDVLSDII